VPVTPEQLSATIVDVLTRCPTRVRSRCPTACRDGDVERPRQKEHGDYATNVALQLAKKAGMNPREVAELVAARLGEPTASPRSTSPARASSTSPSRPAPRARSPPQIVAAGAAYGSSDAGRAAVNLEFVSANPTGPLHLGHTRWAASATRSAGSSRHRRRGHPRVLLQRPRRPDRPVRRVAARRARKGEPTPEDGYGGEYIDEIAAAVEAAPRRLRPADEEEAQEVFRREGVELMFEEIKRASHDFGVDFDVYFHELSCTSRAASSGDRAAAELGHVYEKDGALWLRTTDFGDDKDRVLIKSDGEPTYFAGDLAYYLDKRERGFDRCI
jgi:arginyl-tRNA synthetase